MVPPNSAQPMKRRRLHHFLKQQRLLQQRLKPAVLWSWPAVPPTGRPAPDEASVEDDGLGGTWPPRSYTCAFCRREFRSAQALGGHMNVHRRDRAKMRGHGAAARLGGEALAAEAPAAVPTEYAVLYPILNSNAAGAVLIPSGDVLLSTPMALAAAAHHDHQCHVSDDKNDKEIDLELRLWWP